jgi:hypothetical protein
MPERDLDSVRAELQRRGYLTHAVERALLQDALRPRATAAALARLALRVGALGGVAVAIALGLGLVAANGGLAARPADAAVVAAHLYVPAALGVAIAFALLCAVPLAAVRLSPQRGVETVSLITALAAAAAAAAVALASLRAWLPEAAAWQITVLGAAALLALAAVARLLYDGFLALAIRLTELVPAGIRLTRRGLVLTVAAAAGMALLLPLAAVRPRRAGAPASLPVAPGERVALIGVDGVQASQVEYLMASGDLPALARLRDEGGTWLRYARAPVPPAVFWTSVSTGVPAAAHGVAALDSFRPRGVETPLARNGPIRAWWERVEVPLRLAEYRPLLSSRRRSHAVWELAARGGAPVVAVNWWATFPAEELPGLVVAHGAYQLLAEEAAGAVAPAEERAALVALRREVAAGGELAAQLTATLSRAEADTLLERAFLPDRFYAAAFRRGLARSRGAPRAAALYLPALDLVADGWRGSDVAFADLVRHQLAALDALVAELDGFGTIAVVLDPGRRGGGEGRVLLWRASGCRESAAPTAPEAIAAALLRALGLPQSAELAEPPPACEWPPPPATVATYGQRAAPPRSPGTGEEYLESLRSLGYL